MSLGASLFNDIVMDHNVAPRNKRKAESPDGFSRGTVPGCSDDVVVEVQLGEHELSDVCWHGQACSAGTASASIMTEAVQGDGPDQVHQKVEMIRKFMRDRGASVEDDEALAEMEALGGYRTNPVRVKCVLLPWEALDEALKNAEGKTNG